MCQEIIKIKRVNERISKQIKEISQEIIKIKEVNEQIGKEKGEILNIKEEKEIKKWRARNKRRKSKS